MHREREDIGGEKRRADEGEGQGEAEEEKIRGREWKKKKREASKCSDERP